MPNEDKRKFEWKVGRQRRDGATSSITLGFTGIFPFKLKKRLSDDSPPENSCVKSHTGRRQKKNVFFLVEAEEIDQHRYQLLKQMAVLVRRRKKGETAQMDFAYVTSRLESDNWHHNGTIAEQTIFLQF